MNAQKVKTITKGTLKGNPYLYEETVPVKDYQSSGWFFKLMDQDKKEIIEKLNNAQVGDTFEWSGEYKGDKWEFKMICE